MTYDEKFALHGMTCVDTADLSSDELSAAVGNSFNQYAVVPLILAIIAHCDVQW